MMCKIAFYGNNLNHGYWFVRNLTRFGIQAKLFCIEYSYAQEHHEWWTDQSLNPDLVRPIQTNGLDLGIRQSLRSLPEIREIYDEVKGYDLILLIEDGPALFSELEGVKKVFLSQGADLQILPFLLDVYYQPGDILKRLLADLRKAFGGNFRAIRGSLSYLRRISWNFRFQSRQRKGLRQCAALICAPHQQARMDRLHLNQMDKVRYLPLPMDASVLTEIDLQEVDRLQANYVDMDLLFLHPTRQHYLRENNDLFLKDNDKLLYAYARFVRSTAQKVRLLLVHKGRERDIAHSQRLIEALNLEGHVEWLPEMPNKRLRAYYAQSRVVVCDQYSPHIAILGNLGREATFFGRPIITAFADWNRLYYGQDMPPHVFPAQTVDEILAMMRKVAALSQAERERLGEAARQWFQRNLDSGSLMPKYIDLLSKV